MFYYCPACALIRFALMTVGLTAKLSTITDILLLGRSANYSLVAIVKI